MKKQILLAGLITGTLAFGANLVDGISFIVNEKPVTLYEVFKLVKNENMSNEKAIENLIEERLREAELEKHGITVRSIELDDAIRMDAADKNLNLYQFRQTIENSGISWDEYKERLKERILTQRLNQKILAGKLTEPTDDELKAFYEKTKNNYQTAQTIITTKFYSENRRALQEQMSSPLKSIPSVFFDDETIDVSKISPRFSSMLNATQKGQYTPIIPVGDQFVTFLVRDKSDIGYPELDSIKQQLSAEMYRELQTKLVKEHFEKLRANAKVTMLRMPPKR